MPRRSTAFSKPIGIPVQLGGGVRDMATVEGWLGKGVDRVIIGTAAVRDPALVKEAAKKFPGRVAVGLDARDGKVAVQGWAEVSRTVRARHRAPLRGCRRCRHHLHRHRARRHAQGTQLSTPPSRWRMRFHIPVIASGGLASIDDIKALLEPRARKLDGAIAGRALYDGRLDAAEALR